MWSLCLSKRLLFLFLSPAAQSQLYKLGNRDWLAYDSGMSYPSFGTGCFHPNALHVKTAMSDLSSVIDLVMVIVFICKALEREKMVPAPFQRTAVLEKLSSIFSPAHAGLEKSANNLRLFAVEWISGAN